MSKKEVIYTSEYTYTGPTLFYSYDDVPCQYTLEKGTIVEAEVNVNIATIHAYHDEGDGIVAINPICVVAKYLAPVERTIHFDERSDHHGPFDITFSKDWFKEHKVAIDNIEVGGSHYQVAIQPWDYIHVNGLGFDEGNIVKYATRHKKKGGAEDVKKIISYARHILKTQYGDVGDDEKQAAR